ncbi:PREDICTED: cytochrome P450 26A1 [Gavialis gangeticus]|uniref:cytochrome P450 26A1 n=1 Tax=Gavialis gangeticus TaxID=94835 RepID=UPI00092E66EE|nr:PREDICTED: cytochrome P450 26A1 [Gavialis gangeticus]
MAAEIIKEEVSGCLARWLGRGGACLLVYPEVKRLMFRIAMRLLLGFEPHQADGGSERQLVEAFEEMSRNLFSLPIDVPFSGLYRVSQPLNMQELKESATELLFGGHETTASAATSLITFLGLHPEVLQKVRKELQGNGLLCSPNQDSKLLDMEVLEQLKYTGCVIKETLRLSPPVPGGFRVALKTFELNGYQIPKGWNVIYSICDTHDVAELFTNKDKFNPDRFMSPSPEDSSRFSFIPFGGGVRSCVGKEFAKILLKIFTVELARNCDWQLLNGPPTMKTGPIVYPVDNLPAKFVGFSGQI